MIVVQKAASKIKSRIRRWRSVRQAYRYPPTQDGWIKYGRPVVGHKGHGIYFDPDVKELDGRFVMFVSRRDQNSIVRTESGDGICWTDPVTVLRGTGKKDWEHIVNRATVLRRGDTWYMWYTGQDDGESRIGVATSQDGIHFKRYEHNPVLIPARPFEKRSVMNPCVLWDEKGHLFKMWYSAGETYEPDVIGYAVSKDGIAWERYGDAPVLEKGMEEYDKLKVGGCDVLEHDGRYLMFYIGYQTIDNGRICMASSENGADGWMRSPLNPVLSPSPAGWDAHAVYKPSICYREQEDKWYMWYNGRKGKDEFIGVAWKDGGHGSSDR